MNRPDLPADDFLNALSPEAYAFVSSTLYGLRTNGRTVARGTTQILRGTLAVLKKQVETLEILLKHFPRGSRVHEEARAALQEYLGAMPAVKAAFVGIRRGNARVANLAMETPQGV